MYPVFIIKKSFKENDITPFSFHSPFCVHQKYLPENKPRLVHRMGHPYEVLELVEQGIDIFSTEYVNFLSFSCTRACEVYD